MTVRTTATVGSQDSARTTATVGRSDTVWLAEVPSHVYSKVGRPVPGSGVRTTASVGDED